MLTGSLLVYTTTCKYRSAERPPFFRFPRQLEDVSLSGWLSGLGCLKQRFSALFFSSSFFKFKSLFFFWKWKFLLPLSIKLLFFWKYHILPGHRHRSLLVERSSFYLVSLHVLYDSCTKLFSTLYHYTRRRSQPDDLSLAHHIIISSAPPSSAIT